MEENEPLQSIKIDAEAEPPEASSMALNLFDDENVWKCISKYLSYLELCHLSKVNKKLKNICAKKITEWDKPGFEKVDIIAGKDVIEVGDIKIRLNNKKNQQQVIKEILAAVGSQGIFPCRTINIKQDYEISKNFDWSKVISYITPAACYLTSATLAKIYCRRGSLLGFVKSAANLTTLFLCKLSLDKHIFVEADIFENCPKLQFLTIEFCSEILFETTHSPMIIRAIPASIETSLITYQKSTTKESDFHENWKSIDKILSYCTCFKLKKAYKNYHLDIYFLISQLISVLTFLHFLIHTLCKFLKIQGFPEFIIFHAIFIIFFIIFCAIMSNIIFITVKLNFIHRKFCKIAQKYYRLKSFKRKFLAHFPMVFYLGYLMGFAFLGKLLANFQFTIIMASFCILCFSLNWSLMLYWVLL